MLNPTPERTDEQIAKSAEAYGLPTTYKAAVEEVHEWREASQVDGYFTPDSLRKYLVAQGRHHDEHHAREKRLREAAKKALAHRKKAETDGASRIMYDFSASRYLDEMLAALLVDEEGVCEACEDMPTGPDGRAAFCRLHREVRP
jgi:hypothetical protein